MGPKDTEITIPSDSEQNGEGDKPQTEDLLAAGDAKGIPTLEKGQSIGKVPSIGGAPVVNGVIENAQQNGGDHVVTIPDNENNEVVDPDDSDYEDDDADVDDDGCLSDAGSTASARSNASQSSTSSLNTKKKKAKGPGLQTRLMKKKKLKKTRARRDSGRHPRELRVGDRVPVEIIYTFSIIEVMWQVGTIICIQGAHAGLIMYYNVLFLFFHL